MRAWTLPCASLAAALAAGCGTGDLAASDCVPACLSRSCGDDGCGGTCGTCPGAQLCISGVCVAQCTASCGGKVCGDDGCGGSCGICPAGVCVEGSCQGGSSPGCPQGGTCKYLERTAWKYDCTSEDYCQPLSAIARYGTFEACQTWGCMGGNSRCGDQFGNPSDPERWSCERCKVTCGDDFGTLMACGAANVTPQGCRLVDSKWGEYFADCICR